MNLPQKALARRRVEVVQEVREQHDVVARAVVHFKGAAFNRAVASAHARAARVLFSHLKHVRPVHRRHLRVRVLPRDGDPEHAVARGDVEHLQPRAAPVGQKLRYRLRGHRHHRRHRPRELHPDRIFGGDRAALGRHRPALADGRREVFEAAGEHRREQELERAAHVSGRAPV